MDGPTRSMPPQASTSLSEPSPTITDVAARAGVGVGTVSRVLNDSHQVRPDTRARVLAAMTDLGYRPNRTATKPIADRARYVGVLVPFFEQPAATERLKGIVAHLQPHGFETVLFNVDSTERARARLAELPRHRDLAGLIVISLPLHADDGERLADARFPTVLVDTNHPALASVTIDDESGGRRATQHLIELGHERIAFIGEPPHNAFGFVSSVHRERGFRSAMAAAGLRVRPGHVAHGDHLRSAARQLALAMFEQPEPPTAIVAASDTQAIGVMQAAEELGIAVPDQLSVIGYDDIELASFLELSTIRQPLAESGHRGADLLLGVVNGGARRAFNEQLSLELVVRRTTAAPRGLRRRARKQP